MLNSARPRVRRGFQIIPTENGILIKGGRKSIVLCGQSAVELLPDLLRLLDGSRTVDDIQATLPHVDPSVILEALELLSSKRLIDDASDVREDEVGRYQPQSLFLSFCDIDPSVAAERLSHSDIAIFGLGGIGSAVASSLVIMGVRNFRIVDPLPVSLSDCYFAPFYRSSDVGRRRMDVAAERIREVEPGSSVLSFADLPNSVDGIEEFLRGCTVAIICSDQDAVPWYDNINQACLNNRVTWLRASVDADVAHVGPLIIPFETACHRCYDLRTKANLQHTKEHAGYERYLRMHGGFESTPTLYPIAAIVANMVAIDIMKYITGFEIPAAYGRLQIVDFAAMRITTHEILRLPRCDLCSSRSRIPQPKIWDVQAGEDFATME